MTDPKPAQAVHPVLLDLLSISLRVKHVGIRIRTDKKMNVLIKFALSSLRDKPDVPIILHCFPSPPPPPPSLAPNAQSTSPEASTSKQEIKSNSIEAVPKLVSIVEVIKREYVRFLSETSSASTANEKGKERAIEPGVVEEGEGEETRGKGKREGLHQYSLLTTFEQLGFETISPPTKEDETTAQEAKEKDEEEAELERQELIKMEWLTGKGGKDKRPRMRHTPCMVVVLSTSKVEGLAEAGDFTYQSPLPVPKQPKPRTKRTIEPVSIEEVGGEKKPKRRRRRGGKKTSTGTLGSGGKENVTDGGEMVGMALDSKEDTSKEKV